MSQPRILLFDIETTPFVAYSWGPKFNVNLIEYIEPWHLLCYAWKWYGEDEVHVLGQDDFARDYRRNRRDDKRLSKALWDLFDKADIVIAHNGDKFDIKKTNARFAIHGLGRPTPFRTIDTKKIASRQFSFGSNSLNDLGGFFDLGHKTPHTGFDMWKGCMAGDEESWELMKTYNKQDVLLLEKVYEKFLLEGWITNHPNLAVISQDDVCPTCGADRSEIVRWGYRTSNRRRYQRWRCKACGSYHNTPLAEKDMSKDTLIVHP